MVMRQLHVRKQCEGLPARTRGGMGGPPNLYGPRVLTYSCKQSSTKVQGTNNLAASLMV